MLKSNSLAMVLAAVAGTASAQQWGDLDGTFVYKGTAPTPAKIVVDKDPQFCGKHNLVDETTTVNKSNGGLANVVIYLFDTAKPKIHPDYEKAAAEKVTLDNHNCRFEPHVLGLRTTQTLVIGNKDPVGHNTKADFFVNDSKAFNITIPTGGTLERKFDKAESSPTPFTCSIHPWMNSHVLIREDPYFAVTDKDGKFTIKNLPAGDHTFKIWHQPKFITAATVGGKAQTWARGSMKMTIKSGANSLGKIEVTLK